MDLKQEQYDVMVMIYNYENNIAQILVQDKKNKEYNRQAISMEENKTYIHNFA